MTAVAENQEVERLKSEVAQLEQQVKFLMEQITLNRHKRFGASSEKSGYDCDQLRLFNEAEATADTSQPEPEITSPATTVAREATAARSAAHPRNPSGGFGDRGSGARPPRR